MLGITLLIIFSPIIAWFISWYFKIRYFEEYLKDIPGPRGLPLVGSALELASSISFLPRLVKYCNKYKKNFKIYLGGQAFFYVIGPKDLEFILNSNTILTKSSPYKFTHNWLGYGLLTSTGNKWKKHRKIITPAFHFQILEEFLDVFNSQSEIMVSKLKKESTKGTIDIYPFVARCTLDIICETAMGTSVNAQNDLDSEYVKCVNFLLRVVILRTFSPILANDFLYMFSNTYRKEKAALKVVHGYAKSVINKRRADFFANSNNLQAFTDSLGRRKKRAFLDLLLEYSMKDPSFTEEDIREEVDTFLLEGYDTTASSIAFTFYELAMNPDVQEKVYKEIQSIFSDDPEREVTYKDLADMKYLEMVLKESLRMYGTIPLVGRLLEEDVDWNGLLLPKGLMINIFLYGVHKSPILYENPEKFDPERFSPENTKSRNPFSYVPFSAGPRNCIAFLPKLMDLYMQYKCNFKAYLGSQPYLFICETKDLELLLNSTTVITKSWNYKFMNNWLGTGLLTSTGEKWRKHRKLLTPAFHFQILEEYIDVFNSATDVLISKLEIETRKDSLDIYPFIVRLTLDIICESAMGTSVNAQEDHDSEYVRSVVTLLEVLIKRTFSPILTNDLIYRLSPTYQRERDALKVVHGYTKFTLDSRKAKFLNNYDEKDSVDRLGVKKKRAFLDLMLEYSLKDPSFTEDDICQEINTFMFEGHDTTATSITFALYSLAAYSDIQRKAYNELETIFSNDPKRNATYRDLHEMKYLEMVIKESLRIYTTVPILGRTLEEDTVWNGLKLPKGLMLLIFTYGIQNSYSDNPEVFDPERFSVENGKERHPFTYIPFSAGPRNCIGQKFAMLEMKLTISKILRKFELLPTIPEHKIILKAEGVLKSDNGVFIQLKKRN